MKRKTIDRAEWSGIRRKTYRERRVTAFGKEGMAGLICMDEAEDFFVPSPCGTLRITHTGYSWLSLAPEDCGVWATVMFDENGELFEVYFDITNGNHVETGGKSWFDDLYLDVVYSPACGVTSVLDAEELEDAVKRGEVSRAEAERAKHTVYGLLEFLKRDCETFLETCKNLRRSLLLAEE